MTELCDGAQQILDVFVQRGFALKAEVGEKVVDGKGGGSFTVRVEGPANLWGALATWCWCCAQWLHRGERAGGAAEHGD